MRHLRSISVYQYMYYDQGPQFSAGRGISSRAAEFGRCRGIAVFLWNFTEFCVNTEIPRQRPYSISLYCCNNCDTQSLQTATQACWFQWRVVTFSLLTYLSFYLLDLCTRRRLVNHDISHTSHWYHVTDMMISHHITDITQRLIWLISDHIKIWNLKLWFNDWFYHWQLN